MEGRDLQIMFTDTEEATRGEDGMNSDCTNCLSLASKLMQAERKRARIKVTRGCLVAGPGRGDCHHFVGLPGQAIPNQHAGDDPTVDAYGRPNGWCQVCWQETKLTTAEARLRVAEDVAAALQSCYAWILLGNHEEAPGWIEARDTAQEALARWQATGERR